MSFKPGFMTNTILGSFIFTGALMLMGTSNVSRAPASAEAYQLHIQSLALDMGSRFKDVSNVYVRATFDKTKRFEFGRNERWSVGLGESRRLDIKIDVESEWIHKDELEFRLELVKQGEFFESVLVRCSTVSRALSSYDRSYHCTLPGDTTPILSYRLSRKGVPAPQRSPVTARAN